MVEKRPIGSSGLEVEPISLGGNVFGWTADEAASFAILDAFVDAGGTMIDTADVYSAWVPGHRGGESETVIGRWLKRDPAKRDKVVIATKVGFCRRPRAGRDREGLRRFAAAARDRDDRRLLPAQGRRDGAAGRKPRRVRAADRGRARSARSACRNSRPGGVDEAMEAARSCGYTPPCALADLVQSGRAREVRARPARRRAAPWPRRLPVLQPRQRFPGRQVPEPRRPRQKRSRAAQRRVPRGQGAAVSWRRWTRSPPKPARRWRPSPWPG